MGGAAAVASHSLLAEVARCLQLGHFAFIQQNVKLSRIYSQISQEPLRILIQRSIAPVSVCS
jgi:hypothetical protein